MNNYISIFEDLRRMYDDILNPDITDAGILKHNDTIYLEVSKCRPPDDIVIYRYALKNWDPGPNYSAEETSLSDTDDFSTEAADFAHLSLPLFSPENELEVSVKQFIDLFLMDKESLLNLTKLFEINIL